MDLWKNRGVLLIKLFPYMTNRICHNGFTVFSWLLPHHLVNLLFCKHPSGMFRQIVKCKKLIVTEWYLYPILIYRLLFQMNLQARKKQSLRFCFLLLDLRVCERREDHLRNIVRFLYFPYDNLYLFYTSPPAFLSLPYFRKTPLTASTRSTTLALVTNATGSLSTTAIHSSPLYRYNCMVVSG